MIKAVVFDLDGTLVEFNLDYETLKADIVQFLHRQGLPASSFSASDRASHIIRKAEMFMLNERKSEEEVSSIKNAVFSIIDTYEAAGTTRLVSGAIRALKALKEACFKMGIFTYSGRRSVQYILKRFELEPFFDVVVPREMAGEAKPNPQHLRRVLDQLGAKPEETKVMGDSEVDMNCPRRLNVTAIGIANDRMSLSRLAVAGANYVISSFNDPVTLITNINEHGPLGDFRVS